MVDMARLSLLLPLFAVAAAIDNVKFLVKKEQFLPDADPGWIALRDVFTEARAKQVMAEATDAVWDILRLRRSCHEKPKHARVTLLVSNNVDLMGDDGYAAAIDDKIYLLARHIHHLSTKGDGAMVDELTLIIYHEITHVWQWTRNRYELKKERGVVEGIADYIARVGPPGRLRNKVCEPGSWTPQRDRLWEDGWCETALFLAFCSERHNRPTFVADLNEKMQEADGFKDSFFRELLNGDSPMDLWMEYLARPDTPALSSHA